MRPQLSILVLFFAIAIPATANAIWSFDGNIVCTAQGDQNLPVVTSDGAGGTIVAWYDHRSGSSDIFAQRYDAFGRPQWAPNGVALCNVLGWQVNTRIIADGMGGAIVAWTDGRAGYHSVYLQRINAAGVAQWTADGVLASTHPNPYYYIGFLELTTDGSGGAIVTWSGYRDGFFWDEVVAQRVDASGTVVWAPHEVTVCIENGYHYAPTIAPDGSGGAIIAWSDGRFGVSGLFATRLDANGGHVWSPFGMPVSVGPMAYDPSRIISDGAGGAIVAWSEYRPGSPDIFAQRLSPAGNPLWTTNGAAVCTAPQNQAQPQLVSDGAGGAIVSWLDDRNAGNWDVYAQRVDASGAMQWTANGVGLCIAANNQQRLSMVSDGEGGATITWDDDRSGPSSFDVYAQHVTATGGATWTPDGVAVSTAAGNQQSPTIVTSDGGGVIVAWNDSRKISEYDIYVQRLEPSYGTWGHPEPALYSVADVPADQGGKVRVSWYPSDHDALHLQEITHYSIWRAVEALPAAASASMEMPRRVNLDDVTPEFSGRAYRIEPSSAGDFFWEFVANQTAHYFSGYSYSATTSYDSIAGNPALHTFQVVAHTSSQFVVYPSAPASGYSVDNLAPLAPLALIAQRVNGDVHLKWNRAQAPDLRDYSVYRATSNGVTPVPGNFLSTSEDTVLVDSSAPVAALYYIVTARDVHANQSAPSNEANVGATTGIGNTPSIITLTVLDNMPNPFTATTTLRVGLPKASEVVLDVFDVAGRRVRSERTSTLAAGWREVTFNGRDDAGRSLASGVYFYRVQAAGATLTRKMVITR